MISLQLLLFVIGLVVLYFGAEWLVKGAASLAIHYGIRPMIVGITIVALATSMPEFVVNFVAALSGEDNLALGNIVGSNICNIALILGISALVIPLSVQPSTLKKEYPIMLAVMILFYVISLDGTISQIDGGILIAGLISFFTFLIIDARRHGPAVQPPSDDDAEKEEDLTSTMRILYVLGGMVGLSVGARVMVDAAVNIAEALAISPIIVGLTVVAIGTSLPELAASVAFAMKKQVDMSVGNVLGSNMLNVLFVVGLVSMINPLHVDTDSIQIHFPVMLAFCVVLLPLAWTQYRITRLEGSFLLAGFVSYIVYLVLPYV
ncbi:MAG: calcium/sodium antiporter [Bacteroidota bacterium]